MSLADEVAKRKTQERADAARRANPELEAELDRFVAENPRLRDHYNAMSKEELIRKLMLAKMERAESAVGRNRELEPWVKENPDIIAKVEQRVKTTVAENRQRVDVSVAKVESVREEKCPPSLRP
jgi:hypothetical protein